MPRSVCSCISGSCWNNWARNCCKCCNKGTCTCCNTFPNSFQFTTGDWWTFLGNTQLCCENAWAGITYTMTLSPTADCRWNGPLLSACSDQQSGVVFGAQLDITCDLAGTISVSLAFTSGNGTCQTQATFFQGTFPSGDCSSFTLEPTPQCAEASTVCEFCFFDPCESNITVSAGGGITEPIPIEAQAQPLNKSIMSVNQIVGELPDMFSFKIDNSNCHEMNGMYILRLFLVDKGKIIYETNPITTSCSSDKIVSRLIVDMVDSKNQYTLYFGAKNYVLKKYEGISDPSESDLKYCEVYKSNLDDSDNVILNKISNQNEWTTPVAIKLIPINRSQIVQPVQRLVRVNRGVQLAKAQLQPKKGCGCNKNN